MRLRAVGSIDADGGEEVGGPAVDIVFAHGGAHVAHAGDLFVDGHGDGALDGGGELPHIVGIHEQSVREFKGGAGKAAEDQHALTIVAGSHEFLGHQVHTVVKRGHHTEVGGAIK